MKTVPAVSISLLAIGIGVAIGVGTAMSEFTNERGVEAVADQSGTSGVVVGASPSGQPRMIVLGDADFDFGVMEREETRQHTFQLKNIGDAPATLKQGNTTCKCTLSELAKGTIQPGEVVDVELEWKPNSFAQQFRQSAVIETNDPENRNITLAIHGRVIQTIRPVPEQVVLNNISSSESRQAEVYVYCYREGDFSLDFDGAEYGKQEEFFAVDITPLSKAVVDEEPEATSGVKVTITIEPGLPIGALKQTLRFRSNLEGVPELNIPIRGSISGDISVLASKRIYNNDLRLITLGGVPREEGGKYKLQLLLKGPFAKQTQLTVAEVVPADILQVEIQTENVNAVNDGAVLLYPLTIAIPPGSRAASYMGSEGGKIAPFGKIVIETTHPTDKKVVLRVRFAVEG